MDTDRKLAELLVTLELLRRRGCDLGALLRLAESEIKKLRRAHEGAPQSAIAEIERILAARPSA
jgi:hypothetical protein